MMPDPGLGPSVAGGDENPPVNLSRAAVAAFTDTREPALDYALRLSRLPTLFLIDLDGVVLKHNGHLQEGGDTLLPGVEQFWRQMQPEDKVMVMSARPVAYREATLALLAAHGLRVDQDVFGLPVGARVLVNDRKPSGLKTAHAVNLVRDAGLASVQISVDDGL